MPKKFIVEKSTCKRGHLEVWQKNRKGYYNFVEYILADDLANWKIAHKRDTIIDKSLTKNCNI